MIRVSQSLTSTLAFCLFSLLLAPACGKKSSDKKNNSATTTTTDGTSFVAVGQLAVGSFGLTAANPVTHVVAFNAASGKTKIAEVDASGKFKLALTTKIKSAAEYTKADGTLDRAAIAADGFATVEEMANYSDAQIKEGLAEEAKEAEAQGSEGSPWIVTYVNGNATGSEMVVSRFGSETLDTLAPSSNSTKTLDFGTVTPVAGQRAESTATYDNILTATEISTDAAKTLGEVDTVSLRNSNPDIDNNGVMDATERKTFILDFHNRFVWSSASNSGQIDSTSFKNKFPEDVVGGLTNLKVSYTGTGIIPELEKDLFSSAPSTYSWKFDFADAASAAVELNNGRVCASGATTVANGTECGLSYTVDPNYDRYQLGIEVKTPPEGTYTLKAGDKTFTWTNVEVSDFSAGAGFLALMVSWTVDEKGTPNDATDDLLTGFRYKYMKKDPTAGWVAATQEELNLIVKSDSSRIGFKIQGSSMSCGWRPAKAPSGSVVFAETDVDAACDNDDPTYVAAIKGAGLSWPLFYNAGVSYDDKLGMRFFF